MDYFRILNLNKEPFSNSPDPDFFFHSQRHLDCLQKLELSLLLRRGLNVIIGDVGTGKTTLCRQLIRRFSQKPKTETHLILDPHFLNATEFLTTVAEIFTGIKPAMGSHELQIKEEIKQYLFRKGVDQKKTVVLIIDEGQKIPAFCLEILREFLNYETNEYKLLQIVIFGQKELEGAVRKYPNFADRINLYHTLKPLNFRDTRSMINYRLEKSSNHPQKLSLFSWPALWAIYRISGGYPRKIINLCHQSILAMIIQNRSKSGYFLVNTCARRVFPEESHRRRLVRVGTMTVLAVTAALLILLSADRFSTIRDQGINRLSALVADESNHETSPADAETKHQTLKKIPAAVEEPVGNQQMMRQLEPQNIDESKATVPASLEMNSGYVEEDIIPAATYSEILGQLILKSNESLSRIILGVYGNFNSKYFKSIINANPSIVDPDRVHVGQIISLPAIPALVKPLKTPVWWVSLDDRDTLEAAFNLVRNRSNSLPDVRLIPHWNPSDGTRFTVVLNKLFKNEYAAHNHIKRLPREVALKSTIFSRWDNETIYFANPYLN